MTRSAYSRPAVHWGAAAAGGVIGGATFLALELLLVPIFLGESTWAFLRMTSAIVLGRDVLPPPATFDASIVLAALLIHFVLSAVYGSVLALAVHRMMMETAMIASAMLGLVIYTVNFYVMTAVFPWFTAGRTWVSVVAHIAFGVTTAASYFTLAGPRRFLFAR